MIQFSTSVKVSPPVAYSQPDVDVGHFTTSGITGKLSLPTVNESYQLARRLGERDRRTKTDKSCSYFFIVSWLGYVRTGKTYAAQ